MDFDTFDTDFWNEIQDCEGEIWDLDIAELKENKDFSFDSYLNSGIDY